MAAKPPKAAQKIDLTVTLDPARDTAGIAKALAAAGLEVTDVFEAVSVVHGRGTKALIGKLAAVPGVTDVAPTLGFDIGPP
jgi:hypothetical protein